MKKIKIIFPIVLFAALIMNGCKEENPVEPGDHVEAEGLRLYQSGVKVFEYYRGVFLAGYDTVFAIKDSLSEDFRVKLLDENKNEFTPEDDDEKLGAAITDTTIVAFYQHPGEEGKFEFHLRGKKTGRTTMKLQVLHNDHADFTTPLFPVVVK